MKIVRNMLWNIFGMGKFLDSSEEMGIRAA
jgi:hypothetical protein